MTPEQRVAAGAEWLDAEWPGWEPRIDLGSLDIANGRECICGQGFADLVAGDDEVIRSGYDYAYWHRFPRKDADWSADHGFYGWTADDDDDLRDAWVALIKERFSTGTLSGSEA